MDKKPVHFVVETGSLAGGVRVIGEMANRLSQRGWPVNIWSVNNKDTLTAWFTLDPKIKWYSFLKTGTTMDYDPLTDVLSKQEGYKIGTFWRTAYVAHEASKTKGQGLYLIQDVETSYTSQPYMAEMVLKTYELPLRRFTTSRWVEKQLACDYVGIGLDKFYRQTSGERSRRNSMPLAIARRQNLKGYGDLMEVSRYLNSHGKPLTTFGIDAEIRSLVPISHISKPLDKQVRDMYNSFGCFISTSKHEGFNLTALEAMACGCPVVKSKDDGSDEYSKDGVNCLVGNGPRDIADKVIEVLSNKTLAKELSKNAVETPKNYSWEPVMDRLEAVLTAT